MVNAFRSYAPETLDLVSLAVDKASLDLGFLRLSAEPWSKLEDISIDYAIMEKAQNLVAVPYASKWSDLGGGMQSGLKASPMHQAMLPPNCAYH